MLLLGLFAMVSVSLSGQTVALTGHVTDKSGEVIIGASVIEKGNPTNGTITDLEGNFSLKLPKGSKSVLVSYVGMQTQEVPVAGKTFLRVILADDAVALDDVVVVGYGVQKKSDLTGAITSIKAKDITAIPANNALKTLQGKVAGLDIQQSSGQPGSEVQMTMRGNRSLKADNKPLILVDGIDYGSYVDINPTDIESMEVLKDISSTAIYGTKGANGVIIITTKKGALNSRTQISANAYVSIKKKAAYPRMMNGEEYGQLKREAYRTTNVKDPEAYLPDEDVFNEDELECIRNNEWVDWQSLLLGTGITQNYEISLSGGTDKTIFSTSFGYQKELGLLDDDGLRRYNGRLSLDHQINQIFKVGVSAIYTFKDHDKRYNPLNMANKIPSIGKAYDEAGNIILNPAPGYSSMYSPLIDQVAGAYVDNVRSKRLFASAYLDVRFYKALFFKSSIGLDINDSREGVFMDRNTLQNLGVKSVSSVTSDNDYRYTWENTLNYHQTLGKHSLQGLLGTSTIKYVYERAYGGGANQASALTSFHDLGANAESKDIQSKMVENQMLSFFGRVNYKYDDRYLFQASLRSDGSSVLAKGHKWGYFPSASVAWRVSEESFLKGNSILNNLKLRLSWGTAGNSAIDAYATLGGLSKSVYAFGTKAAYGYWSSTIANPDLTWEETATWNAGLDFGCWDNRVSGSVDFYLSKTQNLLLPSSLPPSTGYESVMQNVGKTENKGVELSVNTIWFQNKDFHWSTDWTWALNREKIVALNDGVTRNEANAWFVGDPTSVFYDYKKIGIWQLGEEEAAKKFGGFKPGDIKVADANGNGEFDTDDRVVFSRVPKFTFGINNNLSYKDFDLSFFFYGRIGQYIRYDYNLLYKPSALENSAPVNYWTPENPSNDFPRPNSSYSTNSYLLQSTLAYKKASFVKLRDVTVGYTVPKQLATKMMIQKLRVYGTLSNFFTFSNISNSDPENNGSMEFPLAKQLVFGINLDF